MSGGRGLRRLTVPLSDHLSPWERAMQTSLGKRTLLGVLTPSSNTVLEPLTCAMLHDLPDVSAHFGRFRVREISLREEALGQFEAAPILEAAGRLPDAPVGPLLWGRSKPGGMGFSPLANL